MDVKCCLFQVITVVVYMIPCGICQVSYATVKSDYETLISAYQTTDSVTLQGIIPKESMANPLTVNLGMEIYAVMNFDAVKGELTMIGALNVEWQDEVKTATGTTFNGGLQTILVDFNKIWNPNLVLMNDAQSVEKIGDLTYKVRYNTSTGYCRWKPRMLINAACTPDMRFYPFDEQICTLTVTPWFRDQTKITLSTLTDAWNTDDIGESGIWTLSQTSSSAYVKDGNPYADFTIVIRRKPLFLSLVIILPVLLLSLLTGFLFLLPPGSGERTGFGVTSFLSFVVVLQVIMQFLPETSVKMSILCYYIICMLMFSAGLSIVNMLILRMYLSPSAKKIPSWLLFVVKIARCIPCRLCYRRCRCRQWFKSCCRRCCHKTILPACLNCRKKVCACWQKYGKCQCICHADNSNSFDVIKNMKFSSVKLNNKTEENLVRPVFTSRAASTSVRPRASAKFSRVWPIHKETLADTIQPVGFSINDVAREETFLSTSSSGIYEEDNENYAASSTHTETTRTTNTTRVTDTSHASTSNDSGYSRRIFLNSLRRIGGIASDGDETYVIDRSATDVVDINDIDELEDTPTWLALLTWEMIAKILDVFFILVFIAVQIVFTLFFLVPLGARY